MTEITLYVFFSKSPDIYWEIAEFKKLKDLRPLPVSGYVPLRPAISGGFPMDPYNTVGGLQYSLR